MNSQNAYNIFEGTEWKNKSLAEHTLKMIQKLYRIYAFPIIINIERTQQATGIPICISVEFILRMCQIHIY